MRKWSGCTLAIWLLLSPTLASAYCSETNGRLITRFEDAVNASIDYLLCLHNEQVTSLNIHAEAIDRLSAYTSSLDRKVSAGSATRTDGSPIAGEGVSLAILRDVASRYEMIMQENADLRQRIEVIEARLADTE
ncbi:hypothetical protein [Pseudotabrizicola alkalilacus]|uniref:Uncharacterized protein n=1 Tax=Pseudotabrizicola alkalilacus TaxID=2305252 RepID=A0A411YX85_9RHOB|nr:hypothetical protein [Pseudotabrizicola alkalilacus]RGP35349.1 hypothetical protein D1012_20635 [Pseudotabrizicola alkalilacus]